MGHLWVAFRDRFGNSEGKLLVVPRRLSQCFPKRNHVRRRARIQAEGSGAFGEGEHALGGQKIVGGLQSGDATEGRGSKHRAPRLFPDREGHHSGGHGRGRPARTASRRVLQIAWISGRSWRPVGESSGHGFAKKNRASASHLANDGGVFGPHSSLLQWRAVLRRND